MCRIHSIQRFVHLFCTWLFLSLNNWCPKFGWSRTFFQALYRLLVITGLTSAILNSCRLLVLSKRDSVEILMNIFGKSFQFWTTEKYKNIESVL